MRTHLTFVLILVSSIALAGCATMSPEQMAQNAKDKNAVIACVTGSGPWGKATTVYVDTNKLADNQGVSVDGECKVTATSSKAPKP